MYPVYMTCYCLQCPAVYPCSPVHIGVPVREVWSSIPSICLDFFIRSIFLAFFFRDCVNILRNISCPIYSILFLFPRARKTRIIPFLFYATPPRIEARRIKRISGIIGHGQVAGGLKAARIWAGLLGADVLRLGEALPPSAILS